MTTTEPWTIIRLLNWTADYLSEHGAESPRLDAEILLAEARGCNRIELYTAFDEVADDSVRDSFRELVRRRAEGMPVAYLVGYREFYSMPFRVTPDVLIPRPETEQLVISLLDLVKSHRPPGDGIRIADIGTGSGILAICAAKHVAGSEVVAVDVSPAALNVARSNAEHHQVDQQITFVESDLMDAIADVAPLDFVVSNPPYVSEAEFAELPKDVQGQEPRLALVGGRNGTEIIERLVPQVARSLKPGGWLIMEISPMIAQAVRSLFSPAAGYSSCEIERDHAGNLRTLIAQRAMTQRPE